MSWGSPFFWSRPSVDEELKQKPLVIVPITKGKLLTTAEIMDCYGMPGYPDNLITITTPYPMRYAWEPLKDTNRILVHKKVAPKLLLVMDDLLQHYGLLRLRELEIDLFGGLYNNRPMRGLEKKYATAIANKKYDLANTYRSRHSWAIAIDLSPDKNGLKTKWKDAQFSKPEYKFMVDTFYKFGFIGYGVERNNDGMHFEIGVIITG